MIDCTGSITVRLPAALVASLHVRVKHMGKLFACIETSSRADYWDNRISARFIVSTPSSQPLHHLIERRSRAGFSYLPRETTCRSRLPVSRCTNLLPKCLAVHRLDFIRQCPSKYHSTCHRSREDTHRVVRRGMVLHSWKEMENTKHIRLSVLEIHDLFCSTELLCKLTYFPFALVYVRR